MQNVNEKSAQRRRKHCVLAVVRPSQKFSPRCIPLPRGAVGQNLISWRWSLPLPTNPVWWGSMHTISSYHGNRPTHSQTDRTDYNTLYTRYSQHNIRTIDEDTFFLPISTFSALGVFHVMRYINVRYLLTLPTRGATIPSHCTHYHNLCALA